MNVSGILVQTRPEEVETVIQRLKDTNICDVYTHDELGRIVVTIEGEGIDEEIEKLKVIQQTKGVIAADMHYSYSEDELDLAREEFEQADEVPEMLNDDSLRAEQIIYHGDLRKKKI